MKSVIYYNYGQPQDVLHLEEITQPIPKEDELLIKVHAATVNRTDCAMLTANPFIMRFMLGLLKPSNRTLGTDFAGTVVSTGAKVTRFTVGDRVFGFNDLGLQSYAEFLTIKESKPIATLPDNINFQQATASLEGAHYAYNFLNKVSIISGDKIMVNGATGAIGSAMVQFLATKDVSLTAVANTKNVDLIRALGPDKVIDYMKEDFTQIGETFDFVFDAVGKSTFRKCKPILKEKGVYISSELGPYAQNMLYPIITSFTGGKKVAFPLPRKIQRSIDYIKNLLETNKFKPVIDRVYSLEHIADAFDYVLQGNKTGNVVIKIG